MALKLKPPGILARNPSQCHPKYRWVWQSMIAGYAFEDRGGTTLRDLSRRRNHGTLTDMDPPNDWKRGTPGGYLNFDGTNDYVALPVTNGLPVSGGATKTVAAVVRMSSGVANRFIYDEEGVGGASNWMFGSGNPDETKTRMRVSSTVATLVDGTGNTVAFDGKWHLFAVSDNSGTVAFRVDGVADTADFSYTRGTHSPTIAQIGVYGNGGLFFPGDIAMVLILNTAINAGQAALLAADPYGWCRRQKKLYVPGKGFIRR